MTSSLLDSRYSWMRLALTLGIAVIGNVGMWAIVVVLPEIQTEFGAGRASAALPYTATMISFAIGNAVIGRAVDRLGIRRVLAMAAVFIALSYGLAALSPSLWMLCLAQAAIGFGTASCFGPLIADVSQWFLRRRGLAVAVAASGNYLSGAIWPTVLNWMADGEGWRWIYSALGVITVVTLLPLIALLRRPLPDEARLASDAQSARRVAASPFTPRQIQWMLGLAGIGCCVAMSMPQVHIVAYCVDLGFGAAAGTEMLSLMLLGGVVSRLASGALADRLGGVRTLLIGSTLQCIALFLFLPAGGLISLYVVSLVFGLSQGGIVPSYAVIVREYMPAREAGTRVGFVIMLTIFGMALGGWMSGWIYDVTGSYQWAFINGIGWNGLNIAVMVLLLTARPKAAVPA